MRSIQYFMRVMFLFSILLQIMPSTAFIHDISCHSCRFIGTVAETYVSSNRSDAMIEKEIRSMCEHLPSDFSGNCGGVVSMVFPQMMRLVERQYTARTACDTLGYCRTPVPAATTDDVCASCEGFISLVENNLLELVTGPDWDAIAIDLERKCAQLPAKESTMCEMLVSALPGIISEEVDRNPPVRVCGALGLCK
jgi:hypothetical protein